MGRYVLSLKYLYVTRNITQTANKSSIDIRWLVFRFTLLVDHTGVHVLVLHMYSNFLQPF
jgi:hypothetical protein